MHPTHVVVRMSDGLPQNYLADIEDGAVARLGDLELLADHPVRPAIALPSARVERRGAAVLRVYEVYAVGTAVRS
jgi:hypothetical protein